MDKEEKQLRAKRRDKLIEALETFLAEGEESHYSVYSYSELLMVIHAKAEAELKRIMLLKAMPNLKEEKKGGVNQNISLAR